MGFVDWFLQLPEPLAWLALLVVLMGEMGMILHFLPTEIIMGLGTVRLGRDPLGLAIVIAVTTVASAVGTFLPYALARYGGRPLLFRYGRWLHLTPRKMERFERVFAGRLGESLVLVCRIIPGLRTAPSIPAGLARMGPWKFLLYTGIGCLVFNTIFALLAYFYGLPLLYAMEDWMHAMLASLRAELPAVVAAAAVLVAGLVAARRLWRGGKPPPKSGDEAGSLVLEGQSP